MQSTVFFDTETGGLEDRHPTIQIAAIAVNAAWEEIGIYERKLRFDIATADPEALQMNSYNEAEWAREAIPPKTAYADFGAFMSEHASVEMTSKRTGRPYRVCRLAGHNAARFDAPRLQDAFKAHGLFLPASYHVLDTIQLAMWCLHLSMAEVEGLKLGDLCKRLGIPVEGAHDALADCRMAIAVARRLSKAVKSFQEWT